MSTANEAKPSRVTSTLQTIVALAEDAGDFGWRMTQDVARVEDQIHARPFGAVAAGVGTGLLLGYVLRRGVFGILTATTIAYGLRELAALTRSEGDRRSPRLLR